VKRIDKSGWSTYINIDQTKGEWMNKKVMGEIRANFLQEVSQHYQYFIDNIYNFAESAVEELDFTLTDEEKEDTKKIMSKMIWMDMYDKLIIRCPSYDLLEEAVSALQKHRGEKCSTTSK